MHTKKLGTKRNERVRINEVLLYTIFGHFPCVHLDGCLRSPTHAPAIILLEYKPYLNYQYLYLLNSSQGPCWQGH